MKCLIFIIPVAAGLIAQVVKFLMLVKKNKKIKLDYLFKPGHMPSAHSAFVVSLAVSVFYFDGIFSTSFAISFVFVYLVIYDALKTRVRIGYNARAINNLIKVGIKNKNLKHKKNEFFPYLEETVGHKLSEVLAGALLGCFLSISFILLLSCS